MCVVSCLSSTVYYLSISLFYHTNINISIPSHFNYTHTYIYTYIHSHILTLTELEDLVTDQLGLVSAFQTDIERVRAELAVANGRSEEYQTNLVQVSMYGVCVHTLSLSSFRTP